LVKNLSLVSKLKRKCIKLFNGRGKVPKTPTLHKVTWIAAASLNSRLASLCFRILDV
jgi:hypothetical protein